MRERLYDIDRSTGFAIFLVVLGHIVSAGEPPRGNEWYILLKLYIYKFHMPFFMFLSGVIFFYTFKPVNSISEYLVFIKKKAFRLMPAFIFFGLLVLIGKYLSSYIIHVDNIEKDLSKGIINILVNPLSSVSKTLWYIYVLFEYYLFFPIIMVVFRGSLGKIVVFSALLHIVPLITKISDIFLMRFFLEFCLYFSLGFTFIKHKKYFRNLIMRLKWFFLLLFIATFFFRRIIDPYTYKTMVALASIPAIYGIVNTLHIDLLDQVLFLLSEYTFSIYLMNTIFIGIGKGILLKFFPWDGTNFYYYFIFLLTIGTVGPIILQKYVLSISPYMGRITK